MKLNIKGILVFLFVFLFGLFVIASPLLDTEKRSSNSIAKRNHIPKSSKIKHIIKTKTKTKTKTKKITSKPKTIIITKTKHTTKKTTTSKRKTTKHTKPTPTKHIKPTPTKHTKPTPTKHTKPTPTKHTKPTPTKHTKPTPTKHTKPTPTKHTKPTPTKHTKPTPTKHTKPTPTKHTKPTTTKHIKPTPTKHTTTKHTKHTTTKHTKPTTTKHTKPTTTKHTTTKYTTTKHATTKYTTTKHTTTKYTTTKHTTTKPTTNTKITTKTSSTTTKTSPTTTKTSSTTTKTSSTTTDTLPSPLPTEGNGQINNLFTPFVALPITSQPVTRYYEFRLIKTNLSPDGFSRTVFTVNGQFPAPILRANEGDRIIVKVINNLGKPSGIHWHGLFQNGTTWYDGATGITQCPIPDGYSFVYNFTVHQSGTYWYHSHYVSQYIDGLFGPLIIHDPKDPHKNEYDFEYVVTMNDWHHLTSDVLLAVKKEPGYKGQTPVPDAALISGLGRYNCTAAPPGSACIPNAPLATYSVQKGKKYRFRLINTSSNAYFIFSIDDHPLKIIEVEGTPIQPVIVNRLPINIAQRYSVIVDANKPIGNYFIRATLAKECMDTNQFTFNVNSSINYNATGILKYEGSDNNPPRTLPFEDINDPQCLDLDAKLLKPLKYSPAPIGVTDTLVLVATLFSTADRITLGAIDDSSFKPNFKNPTVLYLTDGNDITNLPADQNIYSFDNKNGVVEIELINDSTFDHPFHLHGHNFYQIGIGQGSTVDPSLYDLETPPIRDTVTVPKFGWVVLRFVADNPGVWGFHCHIEWHLEMGMLAQLVELPSLLRLQKVPAAVKNLCIQYNSANSTNL